MYIYILQCTPNWEPETTLREISSCRESNPVIASPKCATITVTLFVQSLLYQIIVSHSSCESELMALDKGATMGMFLRWLTEALGGTVITPVPIFVDNQGAISLANNPVGPNRNLHIHARYFYVRDLVDGKEYIVHYVNTKDQLADMLCTYIYKGSASFVRF